jgi:hypothetical protein
MRVKYLVLTIAMLLVSGLVFAGYLQPAPVQVTVNQDGSGQALGDMVTARFSDNSLELIGCGVRNIDDGAGGVIEFGFCQAVMDDGSEDGLSGFCNTFNSGLLNAMKATSDFSFVTFSWNDQGECTRIGFSTQSFYLPEFAKKQKESASALPEP